MKKIVLGLSALCLLMACGLTDTPRTNLNYYYPKISPTQADRSLPPIQQTGVLKPLPFTFKSEKGSSYSDRQICVVSRDTFYYADNVSGGKAIIRAVYQGDSLHTEQIYNLAFSKKHPGL